MPMPKPSHLKPRTPADELFAGMPEHVKRVHRAHKAEKRAKDRRDHMAIMQGMEVPDAGR